MYLFIRPTFRHNLIYITELLQFQNSSFTESTLVLYFFSSKNYPVESARHNVYVQACNGVYIFQMKNAREYLILKTAIHQWARISYSLRNDKKWILCSYGNAEIIWFFIAPYRHHVFSGTLQQTINFIANRIARVKTQFFYIVNINTSRYIRASIIITEIFIGYFDSDCKYLHD